MLFYFKPLNFLIMSEKSSKNWSILLKVIIAVASAIAGALGYSQF